MKHCTLSLSLALIGLLGTACSGSEETTPETETSGSTGPEVTLPDTVEVASPTSPVKAMQVVEDYSEEVANRMMDFSDKLRRRDFNSAKDWVSAEFAGHSFHGLAELSRDANPLESTTTKFDPKTAPIVGRDGLLESLAAWIGPWERVENVLWKVKGAEFQSGSPLWGKIKYKVRILGTGADGGPRSIVCWGYGRMVREGGNWMLGAFQMDSFTTMERGSYLFTDVTTSVGLAHTGIRFGQAGNNSFAWNGAAGGDVNGDGLTDLFLPSRPKNFLYMASGPSGWIDEAAERGVDGPGGGTGAVFFDYDNDGDQDLALADVGWKTADEIGGNPLRFYTNDGKGNFEETGGELGFDARCDGYSLTVLDAENDGFLDVFVCNYGRVETEPNNSWIQATNGSPNALYRNKDGKGFEDVTQKAGLVDTSWTYAASAADPDEDGDSDLYVANDYGVNDFWINKGDGTFWNARDQLDLADLGNGMGTAWGDLNSDGAMDLYVANMSSTAGSRILKRLANQDDERWSNLKKMASGNSIFMATDLRNVHDASLPQFERLPTEKGGIGGSWAWSPAIADLDLDGRLDVYLANGFVTGDLPDDT